MSVSSMPTVEERDWLIDQLAALMAAAGWQRLVNAPLIEPADKFFPDRWTPDEAGVRRMALRLLRFAGLGQYDVDVQLFEGDHTGVSDGQRRSERHTGAAAWFAGIEDGVVQFGTALHGLADPALLTGTMSHEVAHVFRRVHALEVEDSELEERLTDLTTIWLGFGVLTTNATLKHRSRGEFDGRNFWQSYSQQSVGYLPPQAMTFLLALQAVARNLEASDLRYVTGLLETNQGAWFHKACKWIIKEIPDLQARLGLPDPTTWPEPDELAPLLGPLAHADHVARAPVQRAAEVTNNRGRPVFRVLRTRAIAYGGPTTALMMVVVTIAAAESSLPALVWVVPGLMIVVASFVIGGRKANDYCSDPDCKAVLARDAKECPGCIGVVSGTIKHPDERLTALEELRERSGAGQS